MTLFIVLIGSAGVTGIVGALIAWRKLRPETNQIIVTTAKDLIIVQTNVIANLREEVERLNTKLDGFEVDLGSLRASHEAEMLELRQTHASELLALRTDLNDAIRENISLRKRVRELEHPSET